MLCEFNWQESDACICDAVFRSGAYEVSEAEGVQRGTKIVVHLKGDCYDFAKEEIIRGTLPSITRFIIIIIIIIVLGTFMLR